MAVTASDITDHFPELADVSDTVINRWLAVATDKHNPTAWGDKSDLGLIFLTAHLVQLSKNRAAGATGPASAVQSRTAGKLSVTYATPASGSATGDEALMSTQAGQLYLEMRSGVFASRVL